MACYNVFGMKKPELAKGLALESGLTEAEAADRLDRVVNEIIARLRQGKTAPLPGLGKFTQGADGKLAFQREGSKRRG
jgi:nucleoid DNA-binding protein